MANLLSIRIGIRLSFSVAFARVATVFCYCVTLCVSAVFAVARCLSVPFVYCIQTAGDIAKLLYRLGSFFWPQAPVPNSKGTPSSGAQITRGGKFAIFF